MNHEDALAKRSAGQDTKEGKRKKVGKEVKISNLKSKNADIY